MRGAAATDEVAMGLCSRFIERRGSSMHHLISRLCRQRLACGLGHGSALEVHWTSIHHRTALRAPQGEAFAGARSHASPGKALFRSGGKALCLKFYLSQSVPHSGINLPAGKLTSYGARSDFCEVERRRPEQIIASLQFEVDLPLANQSRLRRDASAQICDLRRCALRPEISAEISAKIAKPVT